MIVFERIFPLQIGPDQTAMIQSSFSLIRKKVDLQRRKECDRMSTMSHKCESQKVIPEQRGR